MHTIIDISLELKDGMISYPGDTSFEREEQQGETSLTSKLIMGSHAGTHLDAPRHIIENGLSVDELPLSTLIGQCRVIDATNCDRYISSSFVKDLEIHKGDRVLFKTQNSLHGFDSFQNDFIYLDGDAAEYLANQDISLIGIDYLSIKQFHREDLRPHTAFLSKGIPILEGIDLSHVEPGEYQLIALPLKIKGGDGAPVRAVLVR